MSERTSIADYNERGLASVLDAAAELATRAANALRKSGEVLASPLVSESYDKEADLCLAEAEELIAAVRKARS